MIDLLEPLEAMHIADRMRASDRAEVQAVSWHQSMRDWARLMVRVPGIALMVLADDGEAAAMGGGIFCNHIAGLWFVATDRIEEPRVRIDCHRLALRLHRDLAANGVRRCQVQPRDDNQAVAAWLTRLGYVKEGVHPGHGKDGETFATWGRMIYAN